MGVDGVSSWFPKRKLTKSPSNTGSIFYPPSFNETDAPRDKSRYLTLCCAALGGLRRRSRLRSLRSLGSLRKLLILRAFFPGQRIDEDA